MLSFFRRVSSSAIGKVVAVIFFLAILASFAAGDISNFGSGNIGLGMSSSTLVKVGGEGVTEPEMSDAMQKHLQDVRQQNPQADYADIAGDFDAILAQLVDQKAVIAFADKYGFPISK